MGGESILSRKHALDKHEEQACYLCDVAIKNICSSTNTVKKVKMQVTEQEAVSVSAYLYIYIYVSKHLIQRTKNLSKTCTTNKVFIQALQKTIQAACKQQKGLKCYSLGRTA